MADILWQVVDGRSSTGLRKNYREWEWSSSRWTAQFHSTKSIW